MRAADRRKCAATVAGCRPSRTVAPPSTAWATTPPSTATAATFIAGRGAQRHTATTAARASTARTPVRVRLPNSMYLWNPSACCNRRGDRPVDALGPGRTSQAAAGDPHETAGRDDGHLRDEVGSQDGREPPRRRRGIGRGGGGRGAGVRHGDKATCARRAALSRVSRPSGRTEPPAPRRPGPRRRGRPREPHGQPPSRNAVRAASPSAPEGSSAATSPRAPGSWSVGTSVPSAEEQDPGEVGDGEDRLRAQRAGKEQGEGDEGAAAEDEGDDQGYEPRGIRARPQGQAERSEEEHLHRDDRQHRDRLAREQTAASERGGAEQAEDTGPAVEARRDRLAGERGGDDAPAPACPPWPRRPACRGRGRGPTSRRARRGPSPEGPRRRAAARRSPAACGSRTAPPRGHGLCGGAAALTGRCPR